MAFVRTCSWLVGIACVALAAGCSDNTNGEGDAMNGARDATVRDAQATDASSDSPSDPSDGAVHQGDGAVIPAFDTATVDHVRQLVVKGRAMGRRDDVVAKLGDSITESASFLFDCGSGWFTLGTHTDLEPTIRTFSARTLDMGRNSLNRASLSAVAGWATADALQGDPMCPITNEVDAISPQWALIMYGTNDIDRVEQTAYRANMNRILDLLETRGIVPVMSTVPPRLDGEPATSRVAEFNAIIRGIAVARHEPLIDYWAALQDAPHNGIGTDGIHPDVFVSGDTGEDRACDFTAGGLEHGYNIRNLTALQMLARLRGMLGSI